VKGLQKILTNCQNLTFLNFSFTENQISNQELVDLFMISNFITDLTLCRDDVSKSMDVLVNILRSNPQIKKFSTGGWCLNEKETIENYLKTSGRVMDFNWWM
jgi:hypothetical protein